MTSCSGCGELRRRADRRVQRYDLDRAPPRRRRPSVLVDERRRARASGCPAERTSAPAAPPAPTPARSSPSASSTRSAHALDRPLRARRPARASFGDGARRARRAARRAAVDDVLRSARRRSSAATRSGRTRLESLVLLDLAAENPASQPAPRRSSTRARSPAAKAYDGGRRAGVDGLFRGRRRRERPAARRSSSCSARRPASRPTSLAGQLRYVRERWGGDPRRRELAARLDRAARILAEEERGLHLRFGGGGGGGGAGAARRRRSPAPTPRPSGSATDRDWMPRLVLLAKSTYVWLDQLSRRVRPRDPDARRDPGRGARRDRPARDHRPVADRAVAAVAGVGDGSSAGAATRTRSPRPIRSTTTGSPTTSAARPPSPTSATAAWRHAASASPATWSRTTWASTRAG